MAPRAKWRAAAVAYGRAAAAATQDDAAAIVGPASTAAPTSPVPPGGAEQGVPAESSTAGSVPVASASGPEAVAPEPPDATVNAAPPRRWRWAELLQRVFAVDVLVCPNCGGRMRVIATIEDPRVVRRILTHLGLAGDAGPPADLAYP